MNIKKLTTLAAVGIVSLLSTFQTPTKTEAALTAPASYDIKFSYWNSGGLTAFRYSKQDDSGSIYPRFTRTTDGAYYNYTDTLIGSSSNLLGEGLDITMAFNRSNTAWTAASPSGYYATDTKIGSNNTVGSNVISKVNLKFDNQTNKDYSLWLDISSSSPDVWTIFYNNNSQRIYFNDVYLTTSALRLLYIPSYSIVEINTNSTNQRYLDAWYLQDLGVSDAYNAGYDQGQADGYQDGLNNNPNILLNGFQAMVGILVNFFLMIVNLEVFGVSISTVFGVLVIFVGVIWILKIIRG